MDAMIRWDLYNAPTYRVLLVCIGSREWAWRLPR